jgi:hypothetical protein
MLVPTPKSCSRRWQFQSDATWQILESGEVSPQFSSSLGVLDLSNRAATKHNVLIHIVSVTLDSMGPAIYIFFGLMLILSSSLLRRHSHRTAPPLEVDKRVRIEGGSRRAKVVPINRRTRISERTAIPVSRVGNFS